jgi:SAM-dependent methyltransferase
MTTHACPLCQSAQTKVFFELFDMPVSIGVLWPSAAEAKACGKGVLRLAYCFHCGFIWNNQFDPSLLEYSMRYDNSLDFSTVFQDYVRSLARRLIDTYGIREKEVVEIGCGKGHFLSLICDEGHNHGVGFDPSYEGDRTQSESSQRITYYRDFYGEKYTHHRGDLICCRHVFEHIENPVDFLSSVQRTVGDRESAILYFEVPNVRFILEKLSIWDIIYEHCNYFSLESLGYVFRSHGFDVLRLEESYGGQFLSLDARQASSRNRGNPATDDLSELSAAVNQFSSEVAARSSAWTTRLNEIVAKGKKAVVWGGGAKAVSFLNMLRVPNAVAYVVDINPNKHGRYVPGTGEEIVPPSLLKEFKPEIVILMNAIYRDEVANSLKDMKVDAEIICA